MKEPLVSIILPVYNVEKYLEECFISVKSQTYKNIEIIIVDDGATDDSGKIADKLAAEDKRTVVLHKTNGGLSDARNKGMKIAKGEYITFVDSDDAIDKKFIEILVRHAQKNNADITQCNNSRNLEDFSKGSGRPTVLTGKNAFVSLMKYKTIAPTAWGKLYKKSLFTNNNLDFPIGRIHEDTAVLYRLIYNADTIVCIDLVMYYYRLNNDSIMTSNYTAKHYESVIQYHDELDEFIQKNTINLSKQTLSKHKALRLLSVLNKLALHNQHHTQAYNTLREDYTRHSRHSFSPICFIGIIPASYPILFQATKRATPIVRRVLGKI